MKFAGHSVSDAAGNVLAMDAGACDLIERSWREVVGMSYLDLTHPADRSRNAALVDRLPAGAAPIEIRKKYVAPCGRPVEVDVRVSRFIAGPDAGRLVGTLYRVDPEDDRHSPDLLWRAARRLTHLNEVRRDLLGTDLFADYPLTILLQLYLDEAEGRLSDAAIVASLIDLPAPMAHRWFLALEGKGLIDRMPATGVMQLSTVGARKLNRLLAIDVD